MITRLKKIKIRIYNLFVVFLIYLSEKVALLLTKWNEKRNPNLFCNSQKKYHMKVIFWYQVVKP